MDFILIWKLCAILLLVMGNAFFVGSEIAITSARRSRIKQLADIGNKQARIVQTLQDEPERFYSVTQIGITLVSLALGAIGIATVTEILDPAMNSLLLLFGEQQTIQSLAHTTAYTLAFLIISFMHVVGGELAPKVLAFHKAESLSLRVGWIINFLYRIATPIIWVMNHASNGLLWICGQRDFAKHGEGHFTMSEDEIRLILSASAREGMLNPDETMMIRGVFSLNEHTVRDAMVPRINMLAVPTKAKISKVLNLFRKTRHSRFPVYDRSLDKIVGIVAMKELLNAVAGDPDITNQPVTSIMQAPYIVPESKPLITLLKNFKDNRLQMAVVLDEYGSTAGLITMEDLLEEIVGDYEDEFTTQHRYIKKWKGSQYIIDAAIRVTDLEPALNFPFPTGNYVTLGGMIYHKLACIPTVGDTVDFEAGRLRVVEMEDNRIIKVLFQELITEVDGTIRLKDESEEGANIDELALLIEQEACKRRALAEDLNREIDKDDSANKRKEDTIKPKPKRRDAKSTLTKEGLTTSQAPGEQQHVPTTISSSSTDAELDDSTPVTNTLTPHEEQKIEDAIDQNEEQQPAIAIDAEQPDPLHQDQTQNKADEEVTLTTIKQVSEHIKDDIESKIEE